MPPKHKASAQLPSSTDTFWVVLLTSPYPHPGQDDQRRLPLLCQAHSLLRQVTTAPRNVSTKARGSGALSQLGKKSWTLRLQDADGS